MNMIDEVLAALGADESTLTQDEKHALDETGFVLLRDVVSDRQLQECRQLFDRAAEEQRAPGTNARETGTRHLKNLGRFEPLWRVAFHPRILAAAFHVLNRRFVCGHPHGREPLQGFGEQGLHMDWRSAATRDVYYVATAICLLDDFTRENGSTRIIPGSHRLTDLPDRKTANPGFVHPRQVNVVAGAGSVLFFNGHLLHSGTRNRTPLRRRTLQTSFTAFEVRGWMTSEREDIPGDPSIRFLFGEDETGGSSGQK
jgi:ectoine hydroxylase-related dioxygenase (phytanoyl-CoA dioxygenase family)